MSSTPTTSMGRALSGPGRRALRIALESALVGALVAVIGTLIVAFMRYVAARVRTGGGVVHVPRASEPHMLLTAGALFLTGAAVHAVASVSGAYGWLARRDRACRRQLRRAARGGHHGGRRRRRPSDSDAVDDESGGGGDAEASEGGRDDGDDGAYGGGEYTSLLGRTAATTMGGDDGASPQHVQGSSAWLGA